MSGLLKSNHLSPSPSADATTTNANIFAERVAGSSASLTISHEENGARHTTEESDEQIIAKIKGLNDSEIANEGEKKPKGNNDL